jgi:hypothetical protein
MQFSVISRGESRRQTARQPERAAAKQRGNVGSGARLGTVGDMPSTEVAGR